ncbi:molybdenum cofactor synthesis domain-containing protein [Celeribacter sp.]|uniref:molybdenum cofactor synthesis domain-containing protein n=1 Tax=Celeribacter sp. TaxID=1890673 RepID=UPI003A8F468E
MPKIDESLEFIPVRIAVLAVSDSRSMADDVSGETLVSMIEKAGHIVADRKIVTDDRPLIRDMLQAWVDSDDVDVVISTGGTGLTGRDVSVEAHRDVYEKEIEAFATMFTIVSMKNVGTSAVQSRATGGIAKSTYLFALPGSPGACKDAWNEILIWQLDHRHRPSNFVQMMPRLEEHKRPR